VKPRRHHARELSAMAVTRGSGQPPRAGCAGSGRQALEMERAAQSEDSQPNPTKVTVANLYRRKAPSRHGAAQPPQALVRAGGFAPATWHLAVAGAPGKAPVHV
jgi:hypothetical protein